jgi:hypothetical protein
MEQPVIDPTRSGIVQVKGQELLGIVRRLVHEGNVRRIVVRQGDQVVAEFPLTIGLIGATFAPVLAAIGALAALVADCTIEVHVADEGTDAGRGPTVDRAGEPASAGRAG